MTVVAIFVLGATPSTSRSEDVGIRVPAGFTVSLYADDELASDVYAMTVDSLGRVVVSGRGYIRILIDEDGDGKADSFKQFADGPKTGAQGMAFHGRNLLCTGDEGLLMYRDDDADDRADGEPVTFLKIRAGAEHDAHAIRKGPDGWWYLIAGNNAGVTAGYAGLETSPVKKPNAGTLMRLKPDLSAGEILADGFRNAYDFDFGARGDLFTFDSDGERDVSLPWYRPTRVFHVLPGSNAGWFSRSWKRPDDFLDMPPVVASFGRGSPTGVVCYRHAQFPRAYRGALFVLDWTFGRVLALPLRTLGATWKTPSPVNFMSAIGQFGFAPTDAEVAPDGSLFVSVGGRGTRGSVYRVTYTGKEAIAASKPADEQPAEPLVECLQARQPLSSWSRARWTPIALELGKAPFLSAIRDQRLSTPMRVRAIEIVTELFGGLDAATHRAVLSSGNPQLTARGVWSLGRTQSEKPDVAIVARYLAVDDPHVQRWALEVLRNGGKRIEYASLVPALSKALGSRDRFVAQAAAGVVPALTAREFRDTALAAREEGWRASLWSAFGYVRRAPGFNSYALEMGRGILAGENSPQLKLNAVRLMQLGLGDVGKNSKRKPVYDGYLSPLDLTGHDRELDACAIEATRLFPSGHERLDAELARLLGMLAPYNSDLVDRLLAQITDDSDPVDDVHFLIVASLIPTERTSSQRKAIAAALVNLEPKSVARKMKLDSNWDPRIGELYEAFVAGDELLPVSLLAQPGFGRPGHVAFLNELPATHLMPAVDAFVKAIADDEDYPWNNDVVFVLGESKMSEHMQMVRAQFDRFAVRSAVLMVLATAPEEQDRDKFIEGLTSSQAEVLAACLGALAELPLEKVPAHENVVLLQTLRRLGADKPEFPVREQVVRLLQRNTGKTFEFVFGPKGHKPQPRVVSAWTDAIAKLYPDLSSEIRGGSEAELEQLEALLAAVDWESGDASRGHKLFTQRACSQCHGGRRALGPDLAGVASRFSRSDLFTAIALPSRDVPARYQTTAVETEEGRVYSGLVIYQSVDGLILRNSTNQTIRIEAHDVVEQRKMSSSLMPTGLLKDLKPQDLADLYAAIQSMGVEKSAAGTD